MAAELEVTTIGPVHTSVRDRFADYRDREGHSSYNAALQSLLDEQED